ncbi:T-complex protein 1 subunit eta [Babesia microti strain RI]|uniref:T-complex protein 1 subunit eta n=2 Tax=Babesia microti TaxID=5868 RepID=A0A1R4ACM8_BABMR|nr:T-complex protein 1 subunit eta [Babesia microti strain RI]BAH22730.1 eta subunit of chaperonin containing t-complex polypeptide 1 [Babesia microti]BAH22735.1 eta subunit of chaperonin containing t-complex polypeptide 1 [Babesia microti]SJK86654.1 T-complex protein 1 subunit eta [Babesia microti strain RI]|eukprot:XP_021338784.1 T-complex protein 1 subunit eta [Babesia microti strain RI]
MSHLMNLPILILKEDTDTSQGKSQIISNINACQAVTNCIKTTLGPRGMDKLIHTENKVTITNDGATVLSLLDIVHPAAAVLVDIAKSQDDEVGDGTTSVTVLAGEFLSKAKDFIMEGMAPQIIIKYYREACKQALTIIDKIAINLHNKPYEETQKLLLRCAETTLNSKLVSTYKTFFAKMVVDAVNILEDDMDKDMIGIKKVPGATCLDSMLIKGVAFKKTFSYAGFEQQPKKLKNPKILLLNVELELKAEKDNAEIRINDPLVYQSIIDAEWKIIYDKLEAIHSIGANVVLSKLPIGDIATQFFAEKKIFCAGRVDEIDIKRVAKATGGLVQTTIHGITDSCLGSCGLFEEMQLGDERYNIFTECPNTKTATIILRGGAQQFIDEAERSIHDAIMIVRRSIKTNSIVVGGGAIEMEISRILREYSLSIIGKQQLIIHSYAKALECIPLTLARNSGFDATDVLNKLRKEYAMNKGQGMKYGVDCINGGICDAYASCIWEPSLVKRNAIYSATEAACLVLSIDETIKQQNSQDKRLKSALPNQ